MIEVRRKEYAAVLYSEPWKKDVPARYECDYYFDGKRIAFYDSKDDCLYLRSDYIDTTADGKRQRDGKEYDRALRCGMAEVYKALFDMLGADRTTHMSEFIDMYI